MFGGSHANTRRGPLILCSPSKRRSLSLGKLLCNINGTYVAPGYDCVTISTASANYRQKGSRRIGSGESHEEEQPSDLSGYG